MFKYKGLRIRKPYRYLLVMYGVLLFMPILIGSAALYYFILSQKWTVHSLTMIIPLVVGMIATASVVGGLGRKSYLKGGFFSGVFHQQVLAEMILNNRYFVTETRKRKKGNRITSKERIVYFPKVYYQRKKGYIYVRFPLDLGRFQKQFLEKGKELEQSFYCDLVETSRERGYVCYKLLYDVALNRLNIRDMKVSPQKIQLMKNVVWDFAKVPHALITGGTGGGKTYLILSLIYGILNVGTVDICDPKKADLFDLQVLPVFKGHVYYDGGILSCMVNGVRLMNDRYDHMKSLENYQTGKDYSFYKLPPHFIIVDEWVAYFDSLERDDQKRLLTAIKQITLKGRQSGVFLILGMQRPDAEYLPSGVRDNFNLRVSVGKLAKAGYSMMYSNATNEKDYYNTNEKGRGYIDDGSSQVREFYSPFVPKDFDFMDEFAKFKSQVVFVDKSV